MGISLSGTLEKIKDNPLEAAAVLATPILGPTAMGALGAYAGNPITLSNEAMMVDGNSSIPGVDEARELYEGVTGQTAADAAQQAAQIEREGMEYAADIQKEMYDIGRSDQMPWLEAGGRALAELETMMGQAPTFEDYTQSDYSKFIQEQGLKEIEAKGRAGGYYNTGATSKDMMQYAQDIAGQDYQQFLGNYYQSLNPYMQMAGLGQQQAQNLGQQAQQTGSQMGQYGIGAAQAQAGGVLGQAQAQQQGISNVLGTSALLYGMSR